METITADSVYWAIDDAVRRYPDRMNPVDEVGSCLYQGNNNPELHCIVGQVLADLDLPIPSDVAQWDDVTGYFRRPFTFMANEVLSHVQSQMDKARMLYDDLKDNESADVSELTWAKVWEQTKGYIRGHYYIHSRD